MTISTSQSSPVPKMSSSTPIRVRFERERETELIYVKKEKKIRESDQVEDKKGLILMVFQMKETMGSWIVLGNGASLSGSDPGIYPTSIFSGQRLWES